MKTAIRFVAVSAAMFGLTLVTAVAQETQSQRRADDVNAGQLDTKTRGANIRVSQLMGYNIQNSQGESVGEIKDVVIDSRTGKVNYVAVTYGGFLGVGNKLFAVPFAAFEVKVDPSEAAQNEVDADDYVLVLNVSQRQLEGQQGFDEDSWPNMADKQWAADLDKRYGVDRKMDAKDRLLRERRERNDNQ